MFYAEVDRFKLEVSGFSEQRKIALKQNGPMVFWLSIKEQSSFKIMRKLALRLFSSRCSSASAERNWSNFGYIWSPIRSSLNPQTARNLVYLYFNMRALTKIKDSSIYKDHQEINECDEFGVLDDYAEDAGFKDIAKSLEYFEEGGADMVDEETYDSDG
jgi:hypothetical protein